MEDQIKELRNIVKTLCLIDQEIIQIKLAINELRLKILNEKYKM